MASDSPGRAWVALNSPVWPIGIACVAVIVAAIGGSSSSFTPYVPSAPPPSPSFQVPWPDFEAGNVARSADLDLVPYADPRGRFSILAPQGVDLAWNEVGYIMASGVDPKTGIHQEVSGSTGIGFVAAEALAAQIEPLIAGARANYQRVGYAAASLGRLRAVEIAATHFNAARGEPMKCLMRFGGWGANGYWVILEAPLSTFPQYEETFRRIFDSIQVPF